MKVYPRLPIRFHTSMYDVYISVCATSTPINGESTLSAPHVGKRMENDLDERLLMRVPINSYQQ